MTITADAYIQRVTDRLPRTPLRAQVAAELSSNIAERLEHGQSIDEVVKQLGDPVALADSYLEAVPLERAGFWQRAVAKTLDLFVVAIFSSVLMLLLQLSGIVPFPFSAWWMLASFALVATSLLLPIYTVIAEYRDSATIGKRVMGLRVVRESGARIGLGQAMIRQLSLVAQIYGIDVLFALFTEKHQRAFELASKTRVVKVPLA